MNKFGIGDQVLILPSHPAGGGALGFVNALPFGTSSFYDVRLSDKPHIGYFVYERDILLIPAGSTREQMQALSHILCSGVIY